MSEGGMLGHAVWAGEPGEKGNKVGLIVLWCSLFSGLHIRLPSEGWGGGGRGHRQRHSLGQVVAPDSHGIGTLSLVCANTLPSTKSKLLTASMLHRVGPHIVTNYHCIAKLAKDTTNTQVCTYLCLQVVTTAMHPDSQHLSV